ncbi:MAG: hypothetical protein GXO39_00655 [Thermotogae bacterium]|nr:hypothetical protein [Thermotogota bacterium]
MRKLISFLLLGVLIGCSGGSLSDEAAIKKVKANLSESQKDIVRGGRGVAVVIAQYEGKRAKDPQFISKLIKAAASGNIAYLPKVAQPDTSGWRVERKGDTVFVIYYARAINVPTKKTYEVSWRWRITGGGRWIKFDGKIPEVKVLE